MDTSFSQALARTGFSHRATYRDDGMIVYRLADGSRHVELSRPQWYAAMAGFDQRVVPVRKRTIKISIALPFAIFAYGMTLGQVIPWSGWVILAGLFLGPIAIYLTHSNAVQRAAGATEIELRGFPTTPAPAEDVRREPRVIEIALLLLLGPHLLIAVVAEVTGLELLRGTPWWTTGMGLADYLVLALLGLRLAWPIVAPRLIGR